MQCLQRPYALDPSVCVGVIVRTQLSDRERLLPYGLSGLCGPLSEEAVQELAAALRELAESLAGSAFLDPGQ